MTTLRKIDIVGPVSSKGPLWGLKTNVLYPGGGGGGGRVVNTAPALRGLTLDDKVQTVKNELNSDTYQVHQPTLMQATLQFRRGFRSRIVAPDPENFPTTRLPHTAGKKALNDVLLTPIGEWPDVEYSWSNNQWKNQITIPEMRCVAGAIALKLPKASGLAKFLHYNANRHTVFSGRPLMGEKAEGLVVTLVPEGIELDLFMPNPLQDMSPDQTSDIPVRIRVEPDGDGFQARLIEVYKTASVTPNKNLMVAFAKAILALKDVASPMRAEVDTRNPLPPFSWRLYLDTTGLHIKPLDNSQDDWRIKIDPAVILVRLETDTGPASSQRAIARLDLDQRAIKSGLRPTLDLGRNSAKTTLRYALKAEGAAALPLQAHYALGENQRFKFSHLKTSEALKTYTPLKEAALRRRQPDRAPRHAILPVGAGTLQIETEIDHTAIHSTPPSTPQRSALQGNCVFALPTPGAPPNDPKFKVEVNDAGQAEAAVTWEARVATAISLGFANPTGALRTALWTAEEAPRPDRLLPTGRLDPASLRELVPTFGDRETHNSTLEFSGLEINNQVSAQWILAFEGETNAHLWTATDGLPLVTAAPMLASGQVDKPSELRSLVPVRLKPDLVLASGTRALANVRTGPKGQSDIPWPWVTTGNVADWGPACVQMVSPVAPGLDYSVPDDALPTHDTVKVSMRYDLPVLDELFAGVSAEDPKRDKSTQIPVPPGAMTGVLDLDEMGRLWNERKFQLAATRTQDARATGWAAHGDAVPGPVKLAAPYDAKAMLRFSREYKLDRGPAILFGGYKLQWSNTPEQHFSGEAALLGPMGTDPEDPDNKDYPLSLSKEGGGLRPTRENEDRLLVIAGFAPDAYRTDIGLADTRGTSLQDGVVQANGGVQRKAGFLKEPGATADETRLFTLADAVKVDGLGDATSVHFWVRDLPLENNVFEAGSNPVEGSIGPDPSPFEADALQSSLYEWRLFEDHGDGKPLVFTIQYHTLELAPLRLLSYTPDGHALILCRAFLVSPNSGTRPAEAPYDAGPLLVMQLEPSGDTMVLKEVSGARLKPRENPEHSLFHELYTLDDGTLQPSQDRLRFVLDAKLSLAMAGQADKKTHRIGVELSARPTKPAGDSVLTAIKLSFEILGRSVLLDVTEVSPGHFKHTAANTKPNSVWIETAELIRDGTDWNLVITLGAHAALRADGPAVLNSTKEKLSWLGVGNVAPDRLQVDIGRGSLWIERTAPEDNTPNNAEPIVGISFPHVEALHYSAALGLDAAVPGNQGPVWGIKTALILAEVSGARKTDIGMGNIEEERLGLRCLSRCERGDWISRVSLSRDLTRVEQGREDNSTLAFRTSGISWDPDAVAVTGPSGSNLFKSNTIRISKTNPCPHDISVTLRDHVIPTDAIGLVDQNVSLTRSVPLRLQVRHRLDYNSRIITWRTVETAILTNEALWKDELEGRSVHGPRYTNSNAKYRQSGSPKPDVAGIGSRATMLSGFDDAAFVEGLGVDRARLVLLGGTPGLVKSTSGTRLFGLPWVISFESDKGLPTRFDTLMRFSATARTWNAAQFDSDVFALPNGAVASAAAMPLNLLSGHGIDRYLGTLAVDDGTTKTLARMTEQTFVEPQTWSNDIPRKDWPFFLKALIGLQAALKDPPAPWQVTSLASPTPDGLALLDLPPEEIDAFMPTPEPQAAVRLITFSADGGIDLFPLDLDTGPMTLQALSGQIGTARQSELAIARDADLRLAGLVQIRANAQGAIEEALQHARPIRLKESFDEFGRAAEQLIDPGTQIYASPALGWPGAVAHAAPVKQAMVGVADAPVVSSRAGLAARSAALASGPAIATTPDRGRYIATQSRSIFEHGKGYASATLPAPPAQHLALLPPRVRAPLAERRTAALERLLGPLKTLPTMSVIPPAYGRGYVGARPGTLHSFADAVMTDGADTPERTQNASEFGRPSVLSPVVARQLRTPRSPALPLDDEFDLARRRRTYVSVPDNTEDKDKAMLIRDAASAMWRGQKTRFVLDVRTISIDPMTVQDNLKHGASYEIKLGLWYKGETPVMQALAQSGFLRPSEVAGEATLRAWLSTGSLRLHAERISWAVPDASLTDVEFKLKMYFSNIDLTDLLNSLRDPDPDTPAELHFFFLRQENAGTPYDKVGSARIVPDKAKKDMLKPGVPTSITLPIGRKPLGRPAPDIRRRTYLFADPAFDRVLSSPGKSSRIVRMDQDRATALAIDRTEYDLSQTLYFAFGFLTGNGFDENDGPDGRLSLKLKRKTEPGTEPKTVDLRIEKIETDVALDFNTAYALPLSRLHVTDDSAPPRPGDQLQIEVTLDPSSVAKKTVYVEVPIAEKATDPRPAAVYSVLGLSESLQPRTLLHAAAPAPDRVEFVSLLKDLATGHIRKRAVFEWRETDLDDAPEWNWRTLVKTDRAGGAQMPRTRKDFDPELP